MASSITWPVYEWLPFRDEHYLKEQFDKLSSTRMMMNQTETTSTLSGFMLQNDEVR